VVLALHPHDEYFNKDLFELLKGLTEGQGQRVKAVPKDQLKNQVYACENTEWDPAWGNLSRPSQKNMDSIS